MVESIYLNQLNYAQIDVQVNHLQWVQYEKIGPSWLLLWLRIDPQTPAHWHIWNRINISLMCGCYYEPRGDLALININDESIFLICFKDVNININKISRHLHKMGNVIFPWTSLEILGVFCPLFFETILKEGVGFEIILNMW